MVATLRRIWRWAAENLLLVLSLVLFPTAVGVAVWLVRPALSISTQDKNAVPALAAGIALTGVLTTAVVALIGHLLKQSIDLRTTRLAEEANERARTDQRRLQMETAIETVKLLSTGQGTPAHPVQVSAGLLVLSKLGETALAIDLATELWPRSQMTTSAAVQLCDDAFRCVDVSLQRAAAILIRNNWNLLQSEVAEDQVQWLSFTGAWPSGLDPEARRHLVRALDRWLAAKPAISQNDFRVELVAAAAVLEIPV